MNVLLTCSGRRNYLVQYFRDALSGKGYVYAADSSRDAPAMQEADKAFVVPRVADLNYIQTILEICLENKIDLVVPLNDLELPILSRSKALFLEHGVTPVVSDYEAICTCFDKWETVQFLENLGLDVPKTFLSVNEALSAIASGGISFPVVVKPRWGTASMCIEFAEDAEELKIAYELSRKRLMRTFLADISSTAIDEAILVQEKLKGSEYGVDVINDLDGNHVTTFAKKKLTMRAGETDRAITVKTPELHRIGQAIGKKLRHVGNLDCDIFFDGERSVVLEMNPRFGGGYPFSHVAGANIPAALLAWKAGVKPDPSFFSVSIDVLSAKCDRLVMRRNIDDFASFT